MITLSLAQRTCVDRVLDDIREHPRYRGGYTLDADGYSHAWGAVDCARYGTCSGTQDDVRKLRTALRRCGLDLSFDACDALLSEALWNDAEGKPWYSVPMTEGRIYSSAAEYAREKRRRRIERLRAAALCIVCGRVEVIGRSTCIACGRAANARAKRRKQALGHSA